MNSNTILNNIQQGFRTAIGATASAIEILQDSQKRTQALSDLTNEWQEKSQEWAQKGTITEQEAKKIIEQFFKGYTSKNGQSYQDGTVNSGDNQNHSIEELTKEIITLREELQKINSTN